MYTIETLVRLSRETGDKFTLIRKLSTDVFHENNSTECFAIAKELFTSSEYQSRALAAYILGHTAPTHIKSLEFMRNKISLDKDWRVQEILAQAFDCFCSVAGYEKSLPIISGWLSDKNPNVRRSVTEGLRIWTGRPYFIKHPDIAVCMLSALHADESTYVRKSVGNALKDISKKYPDLIRTEINGWDIEGSVARETYKLAGKHLEKDE